MDSRSLPSILFAAALLAQRVELSAHERSRVLSCVPTVDAQYPEPNWEIVVHAFSKAGVPLPWRRRPSRSSLQNAMYEAERWSGLGVRVIPADMIRAPNATMHDVPPVLFVRGDCTMLQRPAAAVLNSRKPLQVGPADSWLQATKDLVSGARAQDMVIASSYGNIPYAVTSWLAKGSQVLVVCDGLLPFMEPQERCFDFMARHEGLFELNATLFLSAFSPGRLPPRPRRLAQRDNLVAALASVIMAAEVRPRGNMAAVLEVKTPPPVRRWLP